MNSGRLVLGALLCAGLLGPGCGRGQKFTTGSSEALQRYETGVTEHERFYYREAAAEFRAAIQLDSAFAMPWGRLALISWRMGHPEEAGARMDTALRLAHGVNEYERLFLRTWDLMVRNRLKEARSAAETLTVRFPNDERAFVQLGQLEETTQDMEAAKKSYHRAAELDTSYALAFMHLGYVYGALGDQDNAIQYMKRYIRLEPGTPDPRASLADLLLFAGRYDDAMLQYREALAIRSDYWYSHQRIAQIYVARGRLRDAERQIDTLISVYPEMGRGEAGRLAREGRFSYLRGDYEKMVKSAAAALAIDPLYSDAAFTLAEGFAWLGRHDDADRVIDAIRAEMTRRNMAGTVFMAQFYELSARVLNLRNQPDLALVMCDSALQYVGNRERPEVFNEIARAHLTRRAYDDALGACEEALQGNPNNPFVLFTLARVYRAMNDRAMTAEIGMRLFAFWRGADGDFRFLKELRTLLGHGPAV